MAKQEFLKLAHSYDSKKHSISGWLVSEKLDGMRAFWDGGISRGLPAKEVLWANTTKDSRLKVPPIATGLWSRYGHVIYAPTDWLNQLPSIPLDGELFAGRGQFQKLVSITKRMDQSGDWSKVSYIAFDAPSIDSAFADREINNTNFKKKMVGCVNWVQERGLASPVRSEDGFYTRYKQLRALAPQFAHLQEQLPFKTADAEAKLNEKLSAICDAGGEGLILTSPSSLWLPERLHTMLKFKPFEDAEGTVVGYNFGRETDKGSKLLGLMGSLVLRTRAGTFELSGFTDAERQMNWLHSADRTETAYEYGCRAPGGKVPDTIHNPKFPRGSTVTFKYRELTDAGLPKEARYWRNRNDDDYTRRIV